MWKMLDSAFPQYMLESGTRTARVVYAADGWEWFVADGTNMVADGTAHDADLAMAKAEEALADSPEPVNAAEAAAVRSASILKFTKNNIRTSTNWLFDGTPIKDGFFVDGNDEDPLGDGFI